MSTLPGSTDSPVLTAFRAFCTELAGIRDSIVAEPELAWEQEGDASSFPARRLRVSQIQDTLASTVHRLELETRLAHGEPAALNVREASYFMAALADEWLVNLNWDGREHWIALPLEERLHESQCAGEALFSRAESLIQSDGDREIATIILLTLALGFQGQYRGRGESGTEAIREIQERLLSFTAKGARVLTDQGVLFPQAYRHTLGLPPVARLPKIATWTLITLVVMGTYLGTSHLVWNRVSAGVREVVERMDWDGVGIGGPR
jgi:type VI secretion system protein ImpK